MKQIFPFILILILLNACNSEEKRNMLRLQEQAKKDSLALKVALMPTLDCLPFYYAERCSIYRDLGVDVRLHTFKAQMDCDTAFSRCHVDVSYTDLIRAALMQSKGTGLHAFMQTNGYLELITSKSKRIRNIQNLKEKMVAIARHSITDLLLDTVVQGAQLDASTVYHPQINDIILRHYMLRNGTIDAAFLPEPYATQCKLAGDRSIYDSRQQDISLMAFIASEQTVKDPRKAGQLRLLIKGYNMAAEQINKKENTDSITRILLDYPVLKTTADSLKIPIYKQAERVRQKNVDIALHFLTYRELIESQYKGDTLINTQFIQ